MCGCIIVEGVGVFVGLVGGWYFGLGDGGVVV